MRRSAVIVLDEPHKLTIAINFILYRQGYSILSERMWTITLLAGKKPLRPLNLNLKPEPMIDFAILIRNSKALPTTSLCWKTPCGEKQKQNAMQSDTP